MRTFKEYLNEMGAMYLGYKVFDEKSLKELIKIAKSVGAKFETEEHFKGLFNPKKDYDTFSLKADEGSQIGQDFKEKLKKKKLKIEQI